MMSANARTKVNMRTRTKTAMVSQFVAKACQTGAQQWWHDRRQREGGPGRRGKSHRGLGVPGSGGPWGERRSHHKAKGRRTAIVAAPLSPS